MIRNAESEDADRAVENITRKQLNPYEEAKAVHAMLNRGLSEDGAAQALGWTRQRVTARVKILALPERAQQMLGSGLLALSTLDQLTAIGEVSQGALDALIAFLESDRGAPYAQRFASDPGWVLGQALSETKTGIFAAYLGTLAEHEIAQLRLGKQAATRYAEAEELHRQLDRYAYGPPRVQFSEAQIDQARAAGVLIEFDGRNPIIVDRDVYRELAKTAISQTVETLRSKVATANAEKKQSRRTPSVTDPATLAKRDRDAQLRELADQAHGVNLDLGASLLNGLACVDPADMSVARFFVYALLGAEKDGAYGNVGEKVERIAAGGVRLVLGDLRTDVDQDAHGREPRTLADRLRHRPAGTSCVAVAVPRRCAHRRRAVRPRARRARRGAVRLAARAARQQANTGDAVAVTQGPRSQGARQARRAAPAGVAREARAGSHAHPPRLRGGQPGRVDGRPRR